MGHKTFFKKFILVTKSKTRTGLNATFKRSRNNLLIVYT